MDKLIRVNTSESIFRFLDDIPSILEKRAILKLLFCTTENTTFYIHVKNTKMIVLMNKLDIRAYKPSVYLCCAAYLDYLKNNSGHITRKLEYHIFSDLSPTDIRLFLQFVYRESPFNSTDVRHILMKYYIIDPNFQDEYDVSKISSTKKSHLIAANKKLTKFYVHGENEYLEISNTNNRLVYHTLKHFIHLHFILATEVHRRTSIYKYADFVINTGTPHLNITYTKNTIIHVEL